MMPASCYLLHQRLLIAGRAPADDLDTISGVQFAEKHVTSLGRDVVSRC